MHREIEMVEAFHVKMDVSQKQRLQRDVVPSLVYTGRQLVDLSKSLEPLVKSPDKRFLRSHLLLEELGELLMAMGNGDEVETLDGMADLLYVLLGAAITMELPLPEAFDAVHHSNMTKEKQEDDPSKERVRVKGPNYLPPDIAGVLAAHRSGD